MALEFMLATWARTRRELALGIVRDTFLAMARGGIYDQIGGGLSRYSVDAKWLVPHFEKMLYDNALFVRLGVHLWQATHDDEMRTVVAPALSGLGVPSSTASVATPNGIPSISSTATTAPSGASSRCRTLAPNASA